MQKKRTRHSQEFKAKVAIEALKEQKTINEIASQYQIHPNQVTRWKSELIEGADKVFEDKRTKKQDDKPGEDKLYQQIGQLQVELDWLKKNQDCSKQEKRANIENGLKIISIKRQCQLVGISRSGYYYKPKGESKENLDLMLAIDKKYLQTPFFGVPKMCHHLRSLNYKVNVKRVRRLMRLMGLQAIYCKPRLSIPDKAHKKYPYLLRGITISRVDQVWSTDITYIPMEKGFMYLIAVIDWHSRYVLSWRLTNSLDGIACIDTLKDSLRGGKPEIFNTDQGVQFTSEKFTSVLDSKDIQISMDGKGRAIDNVFVERLWRTVKYEYVYLHSHSNVKELYEGLKSYFEFYNHQRPHQALNYRTPAEVYFESTNNTCQQAD